MNKALPLEADIEKLREYVMYHGALHDDDCPEDDTCDCAYKPINDALNRLCALLEWRRMDSAPTDGTVFLTWAPGRDGLPAMFSLCAWHPDAGFCIDEVREPTRWMPLPEPPVG